MLSPHLKITEGRDAKSRMLSVSGFYLLLALAHLKIQERDAMADVNPFLDSTMLLLSPH